MNKTSAPYRVARWLLRHHLLLLPVWWAVVLAGTMVSCDLALAARSRDVGPRGAGLAVWPGGVVAPSNAGGWHVGQGSGGQNAGGA